MKKTLGLILCGLLYVIILAALCLPVFFNLYATCNQPTIIIGSALFLALVSLISASIGFICGKHD